MHDPFSSHNRCLSYFRILILVGRTGLSSRLNNITYVFTNSFSTCNRLRSRQNRERFLWMVYFQYNFVVFLQDCPPSWAALGKFSGRYVHSHTSDCYNCQICLSFHTLFSPNNKSVFVISPSSEANHQSIELKFSGTISVTGYRLSWKLRWQ